MSTQPTPGPVPLVTSLGEIDDDARRIIGELAIQAANSTALIQIRAHLARADRPDDQRTQLACAAAVSMLGRELRRRAGEPTSLEQREATLCTCGARPTDPVNQHLHDCPGRRGSAA